MTIICYDDDDDDDDDGDDDDDDGMMMMMMVMMMTMMMTIHYVESSRFGMTPLLIQMILMPLLTLAC